MYISKTIGVRFSLLVYVGVYKWMKANQLASPNLDMRTFGIYTYLCTYKQLH